jgi:hypothetical protein
MILRGSRAGYVGVVARIHWVGLWQRWEYTVRWNDKGAAYYRREDLELQPRPEKVVRASLVYDN